jgi:hypothetical protein
MKKIDNDTRRKMLSDLTTMKPADVMKKYSISKASLYNIKRAEPTKQTNAHVEVEKDEPTENTELDSKLDTLEMNVGQYYDPENIRSYLDNETKQAELSKIKHPIIPKSLINSAQKLFKEEAKKLRSKPKPSKLLDNVQTNDDDFDEDLTDEERERLEEKKRLIVKIRQYIFSFEDNDNIKRYVGKNIDKFVLELNKKSIKELNHILDYIKFHVRNKDQSDATIEAVLIAGCLMIEKIGGMTGFQLNGLTNDVKHDLEDDNNKLKIAIKEIAIENSISKYFNSPKYDVLLVISQKMLYTHQKNKHLSLLNDTLKKTEEKNDKMNEQKTIDDNLKNKYEDL